MNLKEKIVELLAEKKISYSDLAHHIGITEQQLNKALETKTLEIRMLEIISKELRIPLYSFFRDEESLKKYLNSQQKSYYDTNIWSDQEIILKNEINNLKVKINELENELNSKNEIISNLEQQLKGDQS